MDKTNPFSKSTNMSPNASNTAPAVDTVVKSAGKTIATGRKKPNTPATADQVAQIYEMYGSGTATKNIADSLDLTPQQVNRKLSDARKACVAQLEVATDATQITKVEEFLKKIERRERTGASGGSRENTVDTVLSNLGIIPPE